MTFKNCVSHAALALASMSLAACGGGSSGGSSSGGAISPPPPPPPPVTDTSGPTLSIVPTSLSVVFGETAELTVSANDSGGIASGPTVTCTNGGSFADGIFTAPTTAVATTSVCTVSATDNAGNVSTQTLTVNIATVSPPPPPPPVADTAAPTLSFNPSTASVASGASLAVSLNASDNVAITVGPTVSCTNGGTYLAGTFSNGSFTAAAVTADTISVCTATAQDAAGNEGEAVLTVTMTPPLPDTEGPVLTFNPTTLSVVSGATGSAVLSASDNVAITSGPTVICTNGGSFAGGVFTAPETATATTSICTATAEDAAGNSSSETLTVSIAAAPVIQSISGVATYDFVPHVNNTSANRVFFTALNYDAIEQRPIRGATAELVNASNVVLETTKTDAAGAYSFEVDPNIDVRVRIKAEMVQTTGATWNVRVQDNTGPVSIVDGVELRPLYALQGALASSGTDSTTRNLNAGSGWNGTSYTAGARQAAPFAIMDPIYDAVTDIAAYDPSVDFPLAKFNWSVDNRPVNGTLSAGEIGTSSYRGNGDIFILGAVNDDTDEYDDHVVVHEWGHYFEDQLSRSDSIGGPHGGVDRLDPRVAMGEGFGNALSGIITGDPVYRDSGGASQANGFAFDVEDNEVSTEGWFNETSVQSILYDLFDSADDAGDTLSLGIGPVYDVFVSDAYKTTPYFTTIFAYLDQFRAQFPANAAAINTLAADRNVNGTGPNGSGETNNGTVPSALPVYNTVNVNGGAVEVCSVDDQGVANKLGNYVYLDLNVPTSGVHTLRMSRNAATSTANNRNPDFFIFRDGAIVNGSTSSISNSETLLANLSAGRHVIEAYDRLNVQDTGRGDACYNFTVTR